MTQSGHRLVSGCPVIAPGLWGGPCGRAARQAHPRHLFRVL